MADNKRIPELPLLNVIDGSMKMPVYDPITDTTYQTALLNVSGNTTEKPDSWADNIVYEIGDIVSFGNSVYVSSQAAQINHIPSSSPTFWAPTQQVSAGIKAWAAGVYTGTDVIVTYVSGGVKSFYSLEVATPFNSTNFVTELAALKWKMVGGSGAADHFKGKFISLAALQTAFPTALAGDYAQVDAGLGTDVINYNYDLEEGWVQGSSAGGGAWGSIVGTLASQTDLQNALNLKAPLASPSFTGAPTGPTAPVATNTTQLATTAFVLANSYTPPVTNRLGIGDGTLATNKELFAANGSALNSEPRLRYNETTDKWQASNNGTNFFDIGLLPNIIGGTDLAFVEKFGNDLTGQVANPNAPFLTIQGAINALPNDKTIYVRIGSGLYNEKVTDVVSLGSSVSVYFILAPGAQWTWNGAGLGYLFEFNPFTVGVASYRTALFFGTGQAVNGASLRRTTAGTGGICNYNWNAYNLDTIENERGSVVDLINCDIFNVNKIISSSAGNPTIKCYRNNRLININEISSTAAAAIDLRDQLDLGSGLLIRDVRLIKSTFTYAILDSQAGANTKVVIENVGLIIATNQATIYTGRMSYLKNCEVVCEWDNAAGHAIVFAHDSVTGTGNKLENVRLFTTNASSFAIKNTKTIGVTIEMNLTIRNKALNGTITDELGGVRDLLHATMTKANIITAY